MMGLGAFIAEHVTFPSGSPETATRAEQQLRETLLHQIGNAASEIEAQLAELRRSNATQDHSGVLEQGRVRLTHLNVLRDQLVGGAKDVAALRADIASAVADIRAYTSQVGLAVSASQSTPNGPMALQQASVQARHTVADFERDFYQRRIFDPYLRFASAEDEEAYRHREEERREAIEKAQAENTPESNLRALNLSIEQMKDAGAHGADRSPQYKPELDRLLSSRSHLATEVAALGESGPQQTNQPGESAPKLTLADQPLPHDVLANLRAANVALADQSNEGHGVTQRVPMVEIRERG